MTLAERFWMKVDTSAGMTGCWPWLAVRNPDGYGHIRVDGHQVPAHRVSYELLVGAIPEGLHLDHLCRNRACVNPAHLEPVTNAENARRGAAARTHCPSGHPYDEANTYRSGGARVCRTCNRESSRRYKARRHQEEVPA